MLKTKRDIIGIKWRGGVEMSATTSVCGMNGEEGRFGKSRPELERKKREMRKEGKIFRMFKNDRLFSPVVEVHPQRFVRFVFIKQNIMS